MGSRGYMGSRGGTVWRRDWIREYILTREKGLNQGEYVLTREKGLNQGVVVQAGVSENLFPLAGLLLRCHPARARHAVIACARRPGQEWGDGERGDDERGDEREEMTREEMTREEMTREELCTAAGRSGVLAGGGPKAALYGAAGRADAGPEPAVRALIANLPFGRNYR
jgi:hypothetical protein